ncbi:Uncharacterised protein [Bordetella pertussis]|uniref:hypothetical protein n=1 Tax=Bordetella pertussis TaxID=520 RepID=UPI0005DF67BC|nr:hypothetical protein [Bordetella pertussis]CPL39851.1 Uncharacterised protein [Bordetella pertussis]
MRFFDLFLRRAGVDRTHALSQRRGTSRLTFVCPRDALGAVRKQICLDFSAAGLSVAQFQVDSGRDAELASACITVSFSANPAVQQLRFGAAEPAGARACAEAVA